MNLKIAAYLFASSIATLLFGQVADGPTSALTPAYAMKDLTVAGLLLIAVVFLYYENQRLRKRDDTREEELKRFVGEQSLAVKASADSQGAALGEVAQALTKQQASLEAVIAIQRDHINRILDHATKTKRG
jgi:hypothetical protein